MMREEKIKSKLSVLSKELNELLNILYNHSKTHQKLTWALMTKNAFIMLFRKVQLLLSLQGILSIILILIPSYFLYETTSAFEHIAGLPLSSLMLLGAAAFVLTFLYIRTLTLNEMSRIESDLFHIEVFERRRQIEYRSLIALAKELDFIDRLRADIIREIEEAKGEEPGGRDGYESLVRKLEEAIQFKNEAIESLLVQLEETEDSADLFREKYDLLIDFLFQLKAKLNLLVTDQFNLDNLDFGVNYSLYKVNEDHLTFIDSCGLNKAELDVSIPLSEGKNKYVMSIDKTQENPLILTDFISWKRTLQDGTEWIISLHLDQSNRHKLNLSEEAGKLNVTITQELLWICCELLNKFSPHSTTQ
ncbi:hypothetical protein [Alkalihalophilus pseudofirmus]|uniref:hypothetical protein n=1 Tax=Alkalihalophilus pseudofirmus TaxID=79885 RepID=UPI001EE482CF